MKINKLLLLTCFIISHIGFSLKAQGQAYTSTDQMLIKEAILKARTEGKKVLVTVSLAACKPCNDMDTYFDRPSVELAEILKSYIVYRIESDHLEMRLSDFFPMLTLYFPSIHVIDPVTGLMSMLTTGIDVTKPKLKLLESLQLFAKTGSLANKRMSELQDQIAKGVRFGNAHDENDYDFFVAATSVAVYEKDFNSFVDFTTSLRKASIERPSQFEFSADSPFEDELNLLYLLRLSKGQESLAQLRQLDPIALTSFSGPDLFLIFKFDLPLSILYKAKGAKAAAEACETILEYGLDYPSLSLEAKKATLLSHQLLCQQLAFDGGLKNQAEVESFLASLTMEQKELGRRHTISLYARMGNFSKALESLRLFWVKLLSNPNNSAERVSRINLIFSQRERAFIAKKTHPRLLLP